MKQELFTDVDYQELIVASQSFKTQYTTEVARRDKLASDENQEKYQSLMDRFYEHIKIYESVFRYMYLDSVGYTTIGCGHLVGFSHFNFWKTSAAVSIMNRLKSQIDQEKLTSKAEFKNLARPNDVDRFLSISLDDYKELYKTQYASFGYLDAQSLPFEATEGKIVGKEPSITREMSINKSERDATIMNAYTELLGLALKLNARQ